MPVAPPVAETPPVPALPPLPLGGATQAFETQISESQQSTVTAHASASARQVGPGAPPVPLGCPPLDPHPWRTDGIPPIAASTATTLHNLRLAIRTSLRHLGLAVALQLKRSVDQEP